MSHLLFGVALFLLSAACTWAMVRVRILDIPNHRSSHTRPVPNSGGIAIVLTVFTGVAILYAAGGVRIAEKQMIGLGVGALALVAVGLADDMRRLSTFRLKLATQVVAAGILLASGIVIEEVTLPFVGVIPLGGWGHPVTLIWVVALVNVFNFMDGLDGLAGGTAAIVAAFFGLSAFVQGALFVSFLCYVVVAATLGFLVFNFPRGRIFMGDAGSQFLGFLFAALAVIAARSDVSRLSLLAMPLLFLHFIFDTAFTLCRRLLAGADVTQAHREHLYQLLNRMGWSHVRVSLLHFAMGGTLGLGTLWMMKTPSPERALVILPFLAAEALYAVLVTRAARRRGLI